MNETFTNAIHEICAAWNIDYEKVTRLAREGPDRKLHVVKNADGYADPRAAVGVLLAIVAWLNDDAEALKRKIATAQLVLGGATLTVTMTPKEQPADSDDDADDESDPDSDE
jgi:hypothetical protein